MCVWQGEGAPVAEVLWTPTIPAEPASRRGKADATFLKKQELIHSQAQETVPVCQNYSKLHNFFFSRESGL